MLKYEQYVNEIFHSKDLFTIKMLIHKTGFENEITQVLYTMYNDNCLPCSVWSVIRLEMQVSSKNH